MDDKEYGVLDSETGRILPHRFVVREKAEKFLESDKTGRFVLVSKPNQWNLVDR